MRQALNFSITSRTLRLQYSLIIQKPLSAGCVRKVTPLATASTNSVSWPGWLRANPCSSEDAITEAAFHGKATKGFPSDLRRVAQRKLAMVHAAKKLDDLRVPPNSKLEKLTKDRAGQHSIRINDQFRVCFRWQDGDAHDVEIVDYH